MTFDPRTTTAEELDRAITIVRSFSVDLHYADGSLVREIELNSDDKRALAFVCDALEALVLPTL